MSTGAFLLIVLYVGFAVTRMRITSSPLERL